MEVDRGPAAGLCQYDRAPAGPIADLIDRVRELVGHEWEHPLAGQPEVLPLPAEAVAVLFRLRHNMGDKVLADRQEGSMGEMRGAISFLVPNGTAVVQDFDNQLPSRLWNGDAEIVASSPNSLLIKTMHGQVGMTEIQVWEGRAEDTEGTVVHQGQFDLKFGHLWITDVKRWNSLVVELFAGLYQLEVRVDQAPMPSLVKIYLSQLIESLGGK